MGDLVVEKIIVPDLRKRSYTCPHCNAIAGMEKSGYSMIFGKELCTLIEINNFNEYDAERVQAHQHMYNITLVTCRACMGYHIWRGNSIIFPDVSVLPAPADDMPEKVKEIYNEAKGIFSKSPRASAALLRLGLQILCSELGGKGKDINEDIKCLVEKGLPDRVQKALDSIRVIGNNAVHPGTIDINDNPEVAKTLFKIINIIVEKMITEPKQIDEIYDLIPDGAKRAIEKRDGV